MRIRLEHPRDIAAVRAVNLAAFETRVEADLVEALREQASPVVSLVAEDVTGVVGHILFSPVTLDGPPHPGVMGLAPMAVLPARQRQGIGASLVRKGLERCRQIGAGGRRRARSRRATIRVSGSCRPRASGFGANTMCLTRRSWRSSFCRGVRRPIRDRSLSPGVPERVTALPDCRFDPAFVDNLS